MIESESDRLRRRREQAHFEALAVRGVETYWAERTAAARRRREIRSGRLLAAARLGDGAGYRVLDVGCGTGNYTRPFAGRTRAQVVAIDVTLAMLRDAPDPSLTNLTVVVADATNLPFPAHAFDAVVGNAILHHLPLEKALPELVRVLGPGGRFCFAEPNLANPQAFLQLKVPWLRRLAGASPDETAFLRRRLPRTLSCFGLTDISIEPFDFLYPLTPRPLIPLVERFGRVLERVPAVREIAGSLLISARKA